MKTFLDGLYSRFALALMLGVAVSLMLSYGLFRYHIQGSGETYLARSMATQIQLVEALIRSNSKELLTQMLNLQVYDQPDPSFEANLLTIDKGERIESQISEILGREMNVLASNHPKAGFWIQIEPNKNRYYWMFIAVPKPNHHREEDLLVSLVIGFLVFVVAASVVLWQMQKPLQRLSAALQAIGEGAVLNKVPVVGSGITRLLSLRYNDMVSRFNEMEQDRSVMLAGVAHDLKTPITRLRLILELVRTSREKELLQNIEMIERITEQFLLYARASDDEPAQDYDVTCFVQEVVAPYADNGFEVTSSLEDCILPLRPTGLRRALINLMENALEYGEAPYNVTLRKDGGFVCIAVNDAGTGIPEDQIEKALRPFERLDQSRSGQSHCGLGLVITERIVKAHHGILTLKSVAPRGFSAEIKLPC